MVSRLYVVILRKYRLAPASECPQLELSLILPSVLHRGVLACGWASLAPAPQRSPWPGRVGRAVLGVQGSLQDSGCTQHSLRGSAGAVSTFTPEKENRCRDTLHRGSWGSAQALTVRSRRGLLGIRIYPIVCFLIRKPLLRFSICPYFNEKKLGLDCPRRS